MEPLSSPLQRLEACTSHANAALTPEARLRLARLIVEVGWTQSAAGQDAHGQHRVCKQGVRGSSPLGSTAGQRAFRATVRRPQNVWQQRSTAGGSGRGSVESATFSQRARQDSETQELRATCAVDWSPRRAAAIRSARNSSGNGLGMLLILPATPSAS